MAGGDQYVERSQKIPVALSADKNRITIRGKIFDQLASLNATSKDPILCIDGSRKEKNKRANYTDLADNPVSIATCTFQNDSIYNAFFQPLMVARTGTGATPLPPNHNEVFSLIFDSATDQ